MTTHLADSCISRVLRVKAMRLQQCASIHTGGQATTVCTTPHEHHHCQPIISLTSHPNLHRSTDSSKLRKLRTRSCVRLRVSSYSRHNKQALQSTLPHKLCCARSCAACCSCRAACLVAPFLQVQPHGEVSSAALLVSPRPADLTSLH